MKNENVRIKYDVQLEPEVFDMLLKSGFNYSFSFESDQYIPFMQNEVIFIQIGGEWFDARITKVKKGVEFGPGADAVEGGNQECGLTILMDVVLLERDKFGALLEQTK